MPAPTVADFANGKLNLDHIDEFTTSAAATTTNRLGEVRPTLAALLTQALAQLADLQTETAAAADELLVQAQASIADLQAQIEAAGAIAGGALEVRQGFDWASGGIFNITVVPTLHSVTRAYLDGLFVEPTPENFTVDTGAKTILPNFTRPGARRIVFFVV